MEEYPSFFFMHRGAVFASSIAGNTAADTAFCSAGFHRLYADCEKSQNMIRPSFPKNHYFAFALSWACPVKINEVYVACHPYAEPACIHLKNLA